MKIGIDIGGTFTDVIGLTQTDELHLLKVPSTPHGLAEGVRRGVERLLKNTGSPPASVERFIHGTTIATNAILERKGARVGILTTAGFEDLLEIGRQFRSRMYDLFLDEETPAFLSPRKLRFGITERVDSAGAILVPLREDEVRGAVRQLLTEHEVRSIAVCYLFSFLNPVHELRTRRIIQEVAPHIDVSLSCEVDPVFREYERLCLTAFDAYVRPVVGSYLATLERVIADMGIGGDVHVMQSRGAISSSRAAIDRPITTVLSGPAAGVIGGRFIGTQAGYEDLITVDIGGTSCDVALISSGKPLLTTRAKIGGYPIRIPLVDVVTVGAGGGSIASVDSAGGIRVGPRSAGASPGPACYGNGGLEATVTDASLLLGYLNPEYFAGGEIRLHYDLAEQALARLACAIGTDPRETAQGILRVINARMADAIRVVSVQRGLDPRRFALVAFGGAGPVHGTALARQLSISTVIVPEAPGVLSAFGLLVSDIEYEHAKTFRTTQAALDFGRMSGVLDELVQLGMIRMRHDQLPLDHVTVFRFADIRYIGQSYELQLPLPSRIASATFDQIIEAFHELHQRVYGYSAPDQPIEIVNLRAVSSFSPPQPRFVRRPRAGRLDDAIKGTRDVWFEREIRPLTTPVYERAAVPTGGTIRGPAVIEQPDTTIVVAPGETAHADGQHNLVISLE